MELETFFAHFESLIDAPKGVQKLRQLILQLAVMGRLVPQDPNDEPASVLLEKIKAEKERLLKEGKIKKEKPLGAIKPEEIPYELPNGWEWVRLGEIIELISGQHLTPELQNREKQGIAYFTGASDLGDFYPNVTRWTTEPKAIAFEKNILLSVKGTIGKSNIMNLTKAGIGRQLMALRAILIDYEYIYLICLKSCDLFLSLAVGIAIPGISREDILNLVISLPPLAEQNRIVAKCDRLFSLCDTLEQQLTQRSKNKEALMEVIINKILKNTI